jgi:hypothetical protein
MHRARSKLPRSGAVSLPSPIQHIFYINTPSATRDLRRISSSQSGWLSPDRDEDAQRLHLAVRPTGIARSFRTIHVDILQARLCVPPSNVVALEAQPQIRHLLALPFVIVRVEIGNAQHAIRLQDARQFF